MSAQPDGYFLASADACTVGSHHVMVNQGRREHLFADLYECACGKQEIGNTDELLARRSPSSARYAGQS